MDRNHFMIHLCTFTTLMLLQNNISQKILFIAARTIQFPGFVFKVCIDLIVAIVTSSIYFDVQKFSYLFENIYISNQLFAFCRLDIVYCTFHNKLLIRTSHWFKPFPLLEYQLLAHAPPSIYDWGNLNAIVQTDNTEQWISYQGQCLPDTR